MVDGADPLPEWDRDSARLHVVTGKGGTGKTTVAAALALTLAAGGRRVLLCEVEDRQGIAQLFDVPPLPYTERQIAIAPGGGDVYALAVDPKAALMEYLEMFYRMGRAGKVLERLGAVDFATTVAPGLRDVLLTGKVYEATKRTAADGPVYDAVVLDAPPTGRIGRFLNVNEEVAGLARVGPVRNQASSIMSLMRSPATVVHLVSVLEEMPVQETCDAVQELRRIGLRIGAVIVNLVRDPVLSGRALTAVSRGRLDSEEVVAGLRAAGLEGWAGGSRSSAASVTEKLRTLAEGLLSETADHAERVSLQNAQRRVLTELSLPMVELPAAPTGIDLGALYDLAERLGDQGMV